MDDMDDKDKHVLLFVCLGVITGWWMWRIRHPLSHKPVDWL